MNRIKANKRVSNNFSFWGITLFSLLLTSNNLFAHGTQHRNADQAADVLNCFNNENLDGTPFFNLASGNYWNNENQAHSTAEAMTDCDSMNWYWGDPNILTSTIDANLSFDNPQVLTVTSAVDGTNFLIKSGGTAGTSWATETMDTNTHAAWAITSNGRVKIAFSTDDAVFTMDDGTQSVGPVFWMKEKDVDGNDTSNYEHLPTVYSVLVTNIADCNGTICNSTPSASEMDLTAGTPIPFSKLKGSATSSATSVSSETIDAKFVGWDGSPANLVSTTESAGFSSNLGDILVMDALGDSGVAANEFIVYQTKALQPDGSTVDYQRTYVQDNNVFVFVEATPTSGALNAQPGTYTASIKMTVVSVN
ncbi:MAG: hypothetical protein HN398_08580 [Thiotrichales bacterium]|jgi:hypothetical protein|nr:hypothetical protein [Thiotrichales bacterium]